MLSLCGVIEVVSFRNVLGPLSLMGLGCLFIPLPPAEILKQQHIRTFSLG